MKYILLLCISLAVVLRCSTHGGHDHHHHHHHEDEEAMIQAGKEKWFKKPDEAKQEHVEDDHHHDHGHHHHHHDGHGHGHGHGHDHGHVHDHHHDDGHGHSHDHGHHHHVHDHHHGHGHSHGHGHDHHHGHHHHGSGGCPHAHGGAHEKKVQQPKKTRTITETVDMWWQAIFATILISAAPFFILFFVPLESNAEEYQPMLKVLLSFASGGLLGDAFLHLIPHAIHPHAHGEDDHDHSHDHSHDHGHDHSATTIVGLWVLAGIISFLAVEKFVRHAKGGHHHHHHHHHENPSDDVKKSDTSDTESDKTASENEATDKGSVESTPEKKPSSLRKRKGDGGSESDTSESKKNDESKEKPKDSENKQGDGEGMKVAGFLNLAADFTHNFTDGLAIGASFLGGQTLGIITTLTILLHEVPHEIGDFAILVQSGCNKRKAMFLQLSTATGAMAGCILGLLAENIGDAATLWILPFTAGGFIYIATVSVIPELLDDARPKQSIKEILAMLVGIAMMVLIGFLE